MIIAGRFFAGLGCSMILSVVPVYIAEVSPPQRRGLSLGFREYDRHRLLYREWYVLRLKTFLCCQFRMCKRQQLIPRFLVIGGAFAKRDAQWRIPYLEPLHSPSAAISFHTVLDGVRIRQPILFNSILTESV